MQAAQIPNGKIDDLITRTDVAIFGKYCAIVLQTTREGELLDQGLLARRYDIACFSKM
jgi:hypothetical protein